MGVRGRGDDALHCGAICAALIYTLVIQLWLSVRGLFATVSVL